jgi:hypothetical protein
MAFQLNSIFCEKSFIYLKSNRSICHEIPREKESAGGHYDMKIESSLGHQAGITVS